MAKPTITLRTAYDSPGTVVFRYQKSWRNSNDITPTGGPNRCGVWGRFRSALCEQYLAISQKRCKIGTQLLPISRYISETVQDRDTVTMES